MSARWREMPLTGRAPYENQQAQNIPHMNPPAFQFYPADFLADENVVLMTNQQIGCYIKLICYCWREGSIPSEIEQIAKLCGEEPPAMASLWHAIQHCFRPTRGGTPRLVHPRLQRERRKQSTFKTDKARAGRKGAEALWSKRAADGRCHGSANGTSMTDPTAVPLAKNGSSSSSSSLSLSSSSTSSSESPEANEVPVPPLVPPPRQAERGWIPTALQKRIGKLVGRRDSTRWSDREIAALKALRDPAEEDLVALEAYYTLDIPSHRDYRRHGLLTLLNNFPGEVDRARNFTPDSLHPRTSSNGDRNGHPNIGRSNGKAFEAYAAEHDRLWGTNGVAAEEPLPAWARGPET